MIRQAGNARGGKGLAGRFHADQVGAVTIEWALILAAVALPMFYVFRVCLDILTEHYRMITLFNSLPFP